MSRRLVPIHEVAEALGVSARTLRRWEREGRLLPVYGSRSRKNQKLLDSVKKAVEESQSC